jgi:hypothetical protein
MRLKLLRRRLTISAPRMAVRSALPWPFRWAMLAIVLGFCAAIALWAFEFGKDIAGLESGSKEEATRLRGELVSLQAELATIRAERDQAQSVANTAGTLVTTEKASQERLVEQIRQLELENRSLRDDMGFFETLVPASGGDGLAIRALQAEFNGRLELTFTGFQNGKPWSAVLPGEHPAIKVRQYGRLGGEFEVPPHVQVKGVSARVMDGAVAKATHTIKL